MIVVSNTTPLHYLVLTGESHLPPVLYDRVLIPPAVIAELSSRATPDMVRQWIRQRPPWLEVRAPEGMPQDFQNSSTQASAKPLP